MRNDISAEAVSINGLFLEDAISGYRTITTTGREALPIDIETYSVGSADGTVFKSSKKAAREIEVEFVIQGDSMPDLRAKLDHLNNILSADESDFVFNDEENVYYTGKILPNESITKYHNGLRGSFKIYCAYPFKRSIAVNEAVPSVVDGNSAQIVINYNGTYPARPVLQATFAGAKSGGNYSDDGDCGYVAFIDAAENIIQLGNPDAIDLDAYTEATQLINREFTAKTGFNTSGGNTFDDELVEGSVTANTEITDLYWSSGTVPGGQKLKYVVPSYGSNTDGWHGPILWQKPDRNGAADWSMSLVHRLCCSDPGQCGSFEVGCYNINGDIAKMVAGILIIKDTAGNNGTVKYIVNNKVVKIESIDLSYYNTHFGYCNCIPVYQTQYYNKKKKKWQTAYKKGAKTRSVLAGYSYSQSNLNTSIEKCGNAVTFKVGNLAAFTFTNNDVEYLAAHNVSMHFGQLKDLPALHTNAVNSLRFTSNPTGTFADIPNVFTSGDVVEADCNNASVWLKHANTEEGQLAPQYGALGNDWEDFSLQKGTNIINVVWSDWVNPDYKPTVKIMYNEVYL